MLTLAEAVSDPKWLRATHSPSLPAAEKDTSSI